MRYLTTTFVGVLTILLAGCQTEGDGGSNPLAPTTLAALLSGDLQSVSPSGAMAPVDSCGDFQWSITEVNPPEYSGSFSATCADGTTLEGTATGTLVGDVLNLTASGTATPKDQPACPFSLTGTARLMGEALHIDYTGTTCLGPVSGTEVLTST